MRARSSIGYIPESGVRFSPDRPSNASFERQPRDSLHRLVHDKLHSCGVHAMAHESYPQRPQASQHTSLRTTYQRNGFAMSRAKEAIETEKRHLRIPTACVLNGRWEMPSPQSWLSSKSKRPDSQPPPCREFQAIHLAVTSYYQKIDRSPDVVPQSDPRLPAEGRPAFTDVSAPTAYRAV
jgi:hypothetical protein